MTHSIGIVTYANAVHGWALDLPGCIAGAADIDALREPMALAIAEHAAWLRVHGDDVASDGAWEIAEALDGESMAATGGEYCFAYDRAPLGADEMERQIRWMRWSRDDLLASVADLPDVLLDWAPPSSAIAQFDAWAPEVRTLREIAEHVLQLEAYYRGGLRDGASAGIFERVGDPASERARTVEALRALSSDDRSRVYRPVRPGRPVAEDWTVRKLVRRIISHERVHTAEVRQRLSWVHLGVPRVR